MIFYLSAYSTTKHYGRELNKHIKLLPDDAWIVVRDGDAMFLTPNYGRIIEQAIEDNPDATLMSCRTNRAWGHGFNPDTDIVRHYHKAVELEGKEPKYTPVKTVLPAFLWIFPKKTWLQNKFDDHPIVWKFNSFDTRFCRKLRGKMLIIERLYIFHYYRLHDKSKSSMHLL